MGRETELATLLAFFGNASAGERQVVFMQGQPGIGKTSIGWLAEDGGVWRLSADRAAIEQEVPDDIQRLIQGQLRFVSRAERDVLEVASVIAVAFDAPAVAAGRPRTRRGRVALR